MKQALTQKELYAKLLPLKTKMTQFKQTDTATLTAEDVVLMQDVYADVNTLTHGQLPIKLQVGCASCIREVFHIFISLFDRLGLDPEITQEGADLEQAARDIALNPQANPADAMTITGDEPFSPTADELTIIKDIMSKLDEHSDDFNEVAAEAINKLNGVATNEAHRPAFRKFIEEKIPEIQAAIDQLKADPNDLSGLPLMTDLEAIYKRLALVGIDTLDGELATLGTVLDVDGYPGNITDEEREILQERYDELNNRDKTLGTIETDGSFSHTPEESNQVPSGNPEPHGVVLPPAENKPAPATPADHVTGVAMNTPETLTPQQKAAATRAKKAQDAAAKHNASKQ